VKSTYLKNFI